MKKYLKKIAVLLAIIIMFAISSFTIADVGNFESYDSGSDWDSSSDWGSSSLDSDWGGSSSWDSDSSYSDSGDLGIGTLITFVIIVIIVVAVTKRNKGGVSTSNINVGPQPSSIPNNPNVLRQIQAVDEFFNEDKFLSWAKNMFVKLQECWTKRDWETIRTFETEELFEQHSTQLKQYIDKKQINVMDRIAVNYAKLYSFTQDNDKDTLKILLNSSMIDYIIDEETQKVVMGDKTTRRTRTYVMTFIRKKGLKTEESTGETKTSNCPNCGAPTKVTSAGKCEYCGAIITKGDHDWVLSNLEPYRG